MKRLAYLDQMKGVAILLVVIGHVLLFSFGKSGNSVFRMLSIIHIPVFFYVSGYLAYRSIPTIQEWRSRLWKKIHGLLFPYLVFAGLYCFFRGKDFLHLLSVGGAEYWFMHVLLLLSLFFVSFEQVAKRLKHPALYITAWLVPYALLIIVQRYYGEVGGGHFCNQSDGGLLSILPLGLLM